MAAEKEILPPAVALRRVEEAAGDARGNGGAGSKGAPPSLKFHFVKLFGVADVLKFADGTTYSFRKILRNNNQGFARNSFVKTDDEKLTANLREAAKNKAWGIVEIK